MVHPIYPIPIRFPLRLKCRQAQRARIPIPVDPLVGAHAIEFQIAILEMIGSRLRIFLQEEPGNLIPQLAIAQLVDRCSTCVLPDARPTFQLVRSSAAFVDVRPSLSRTARAAFVAAFILLRVWSFLPLLLLRRQQRGLWLK
jgi:hypothetical protein